MVIADDISGPQLVDVLGQEAARRGVRLGDLVRPMSSQPSRWICMLRIAARPKPVTVARVRALLAGEAVEPSVQRIVQTRIAAGRQDPAMRVLKGLDAGDHDPIDRNPCWRCGVRPEVGCRHRRVV